MQAVLEACLVFPTVFFSLLLGLVLIYWICVVLGAVDIDVFDIDADLGADLDADLDGDVEGHGLFADLLARLDITEVPLTVSLSLFALSGWLFTFAAVELIGSFATAFVWGSAILVTASGVSLLLTSRFAQLLKPMFRTHFAPSNRSFVGQVCEITTLRVDDHYGQAEVRDGGAGLLIQVRSSNADELARGSKALIFDYDARREIFFVKPISDAEPATAN